MKKYLFLLIPVLIVFVVVIVLLAKNDKLSIGVNKEINNTQDSYFAQGYIVFKEGKVYFFDEKEIKDSNITGYLKQSLKKDHPSHLILYFNDSNAVKDLQTGDKIKIWINELLESDPGRGTVTKYEKIR